MNFLITGGAGSVGKDLAGALLNRGHRVRILDRAAPVTLPHGSGAEIEWLQGDLADSRLLPEALKGVEVVIHLAWSFSDDPLELLGGDLKGHVCLLDACADAGVTRLFYASTAVVYGKPASVPLREDAPALVAEARKPFYAVAKLTAENLCLVYGKSRGLRPTVFRFWWSFGEIIGGRHLRDMIMLAQGGKPILVPDGAGGSFLDHDDLIHALFLAGPAEGSVGQVFNLATLYLEWQEIARMIMAVTGSASRLEVIPAGEWSGAPFLADPWELSTAKAEERFGYRSLFAPAEARQRLERAIRRCREELTQGSA